MNFYNDEMTYLNKKLKNRIFLSADEIKHQKNLLMADGR